MRGAERDSCWVQRDKERTELHQQSPVSAESSGLACCAERKILDLVKVTAFPQTRSKT